MHHTITFHPDGNATTLYTDQIDLRQLGSLTVERASRIEFNNATGQWDVFFPDSCGCIRRIKPVFSHKSREECLRWEREQLNQ